MVQHTIYYQDLKAEAQQEIWEKVMQTLVEDGWVMREEWETEEEFFQKLQEETDYYINTHNFAIEYKL